MTISRPIVWTALVVIVAVLLVYLPSDEDGHKSKRSDLQALLTGEMSKVRLYEDGAHFPDLVFRHEALERDIALSDYKGRVVLLNLWATWCAPCVKELPSLDRLQKELAGDDFVVLALSMDRQGADVVVPFLDRINVINLDVLTDSKALAMRKLKSASLPITILVDKEGRPTARLDGPAHWDGKEAKALIKALIAS